MSAMDPLVQRLGMKPKVQAGRNNAGWTIHIAAPPGFSTKIDVAPEDVLEWYVTVFDGTGAQVWNDWSDYLGYEKHQDPAAELKVMIEEIEWFVTTMVDVKGFRVWSEPVIRKFGITFGRTKVAEWLRNERWQRVALSDGDVDALFPPLVRDRQIA